MPGNFFDATVTRGAVFSALGGQFRVSNPVDPPNGDVRFSTLLPNSVTDQFQTFSPKRLFTPFLSNVMAMTFRIPAKGIVARTSGFGAVFTDVDLFSGTTLTYFDSKGCIIARIAVPPRNRGLSFAGIVVVNHSGRRISVIKKVVMKFGNVAVAKAGKSKGDVVVADDFLYGEPRV